MSKVHVLDSNRTFGIQSFSFGIFKSIIILVLYVKILKDIFQKRLFIGLRLLALVDILR